MVFRVLTTRVSGKARWICSPSESVSLTNKVGGRPAEKSSGFAMSSSTLPARWSAPARPRTSRDTAPLVAFTISSAPAAASAKEATSTPGWAFAHSAYGGLPMASASDRVRVARGSRVPTVTVWPSSFRRSAMARPTMPVPRTAMFTRIPPGSG
jgi:hypothetical protein